MGCGFNGGPSNCPAKRFTVEGRVDEHGAVRPILPLQWRAEQLPGQTLAVSKLHRGRMDARRAVCFNGGPSNCPAKPGAYQRRRASLGAPRTSFNGGPSNCPAKRHDTQPSRADAIARPNLSGGPLAAPEASMEGRAIARPNRSIIGPARSPSRAPCFNGGPSNCPAKREPQARRR